MLSLPLIQDKTEKYITNPEGFLKSDIQCVCVWIVVHMMLRLEVFFSHVCLGFGRFAACDVIPHCIYRI